MNGEQFYRDHIIKWKNKGISIRAYCRDNQISYDAFQYWRYKKDYAQKNNLGNKRVSLKSPPSKVSNSFIPLDIKDSKDIFRNLSGLEIRIEPDGAICIRIGREL